MESADESGERATLESGALAQCRHSLLRRCGSRMGAGGLMTQFLQTVLVHLRHLATMSRAHSPYFAVLATAAVLMAAPFTVAACSMKYRSAARAL